MKILSELINCNYNIPISSIEDDSRTKDKDYLFCAIKGLNVDGHDFIDTAITNGACAVIGEKPLKNIAVPYIKVKDSSKAMNEALNKFYNEPLNTLNLIGVTGTDGKTTISTMIYQLINQFSNCGHIGTKTVKCNGYSSSQPLTTPLPKDLFKIFDTFKKNDCKYVSMEVSSERLATNRLNGILFQCSIFTNITREHLNSHKTMENYINAKAKLFEQTRKEGLCIINNDDDFAPTFIKKANAKTITYAINNKADIFATDIVVKENLLMFNINGYLGKHKVISPLSGKFNVYNLMAVIACLDYLGFDLEKIISYIKYLKPVEGRLEEVEAGQPFKIIVDFAHTANAVKNLIEYAKTITDGRVISVLGTGGDRFLGRKTDLGKTVIDLADYVFITTYNPRGEEPMDLANQMLLEADKAKNNFSIILDREEAIKKAIDMAKENDIILITGKGREYFQVYKDKKIPYEGDFEIAFKYAKKLYQKTN